MLSLLYAAGWRSDHHHCQELHELNRAHAFMCLQGGLVIQHIPGFSYCQLVAVGGT